MDCYKIRTLCIIHHYRKLIEIIEKNDTPLIADFIRQLHKCYTCLNRLNRIERLCFINKIIMFSLKTSLKMDGRNSEFE